MIPELLIKTSKLTTKEKKQLIDTHRIRHAWHASVNAGRILHNSDSSEITKDQITQEHQQLVAKMLEQEVQHYMVDSLDETLGKTEKDASLERGLSGLPRDVLVAKDFISIIGDFNKDQSNDVINILIKAPTLKKSLGISTLNVTDPINRLLKNEDDDNLRFVFSPTGTDQQTTPLYDLVLKKKNPSESIVVKDLVKLDLYCGENKAPGFIGIDKVYYDSVDVVQDLSWEKIPYPNNSVSEIRAIHFLEKMSSPDFVMKEIHRVLIDGGMLHFVVSSTKGEGAFAHPEHQSWWNKSSFAYWTVPELLGDRPLFAIESLNEVVVNEDVIEIHGTLVAVKQDSIKKDNALKPLVSSWIPPSPVNCVLTDSYDSGMLWNSWAMRKAYPNEHACRLEDPSGFSKFTRQNGDQSHDGKPIDVIYGISEGKSKIQALRYPKSRWSEESAHTHCQGRGGMFEAAKKGDEQDNFSIPLYIEPKYSFFKAVIEKSDNQERMWFIDSKNVNRLRLLNLQSVFKDVHEDFIIECFVGIQKDGKWVNIADMEILKDKNASNLNNNDVKIMLSDVLFWREDVHNKPFSVRKELINKFYESFLSKDGQFELIPSYECITKRGFTSKVEEAAKLSGSVGAVVKTATGGYSLKGVTDEIGELRNTIGFNAKVLDVHELKNNEYSYDVGLRDNESNYINIGRTLSTRFVAKVDDTMYVQSEEIINQENISASRTRVFGVISAKDEILSINQFLDSLKDNALLRQSQVVKDESVNEDDSFWKTHWVECFPKSGKGSFIYHHHWKDLTTKDMGQVEEELMKSSKSVLGSLTFENDNGRIFEWSIVLGRGSDLQKNLDLNGDQPLPFQCFPKQSDLNIESIDKSSCFIKPGESRASKDLWAKLFKVDKGEYQIGVWKDDYIEIFLKGEKLDRRVVMNKSIIEGKETWTVSTPLDQTPYADTINKEVILKDAQKKRQKYFVWGKPGLEPELVSVSNDIMFFKKDQMRQIVWGVVYEPDVVDAQGEYAVSEDIEKAAHDYLENFRETMLSHKSDLDASIVESFIAPVTYSIDGEVIRKGSWVAAMKVKDSAAWQRIMNGEIVGFSMGGRVQYV